MLRMCTEQQWSVGDLDWSQSPRSMSTDDEGSVVQYFTDMAQIERLAGALFVEQQRRVEAAVLKDIFATFVVDEMRHSHVAQMLADHYDVRRLRTYRVSPTLERFSEPAAPPLSPTADSVSEEWVQRFREEHQDNWQNRGW